MSHHGRRVIMPQMCRYPGHEHTWIKAKKQSDLLIIFFIRKRACHICTPLCPLFRRSRYSAYYGCSKNYFVSFLLYIDIVFCFFAPEKQYSGKTYFHIPACRGSN